MIRRDVVRRRREHRGQRIAERSLDDVEQQAERAEDDDRCMQPGHGQAVEARRDTGVSGHVFVQAAALMEERNAQRVK